MTKRREHMTPEERERACAQRRALYQRKRQQELEWARRYREANKEAMPAYWRESNRKRKDYFDRYNAENRDRIASRRARWKAENRERVAAVQAAYLQRNLDRHRAHQHNRRARKAANGGALSSDIVRKLFALQRGKCACCGVPLGTDYDLDHIVPLALGGANSDANVQLLKARCNRQKGSSDPVAFMQRRGRLL